MRLQKAAEALREKSFLSRIRIGNLGRDSC